MKWKLSDIESVPKNGLRVFSCFCCGGGSSMGYKLSGFECLGGVEIDKKMASLYIANLKPKLFFNEPIQEFNKRTEFPDELKSLDVLDGSPPCSSFSMAGSREKAWGEKKKFREGQALQVLDDLFFHFLDTAELLRPKIIVAENVKGLIAGNARGYVKLIFSRLDELGYDAQLFLLDASKMGVPQRRQRTFFIARRKDLTIPSLKLSFNEPVITAEEATKECKRDGKPLSVEATNLWLATDKGKSLSTAHPKGNWFTWTKLDPRKPANTMIAAKGALHWDEPRHLSDSERIAIQSFPTDYDFGAADIGYVCGMSVPPLMMNRVANEITKLLIMPRALTSPANQ